MPTPTRRRLFSIVLLAAAAAVAGPLGPRAAAQASRPNVVLVTLDGARTEEIFGGLDLAVLQSTLRQNQKVEEQEVYRRFWADSPEARRQKLMPFLWNTLIREHGSIAGDAATGSAVTLTNTHRFSYPGYAEILLGEAHDDTIKSNDPLRNPYVTVLEELRTALGLTPAQVCAFTSWNVFDAIVEHTPGALTVNAGFEAFDAPDPAIQALSRLQFETPTPWNSVRHDVYTFRLAMSHLKTARPRVMYLSLGETDDWAHDGRYDRVLETYARSDAYLGELWAWLQADPEYRNQTMLIVTTDHGRGRTPADWKDHGAKVEGAQHVWIAMAGPSLSARGEWKSHEPLHTNQIAATMARWMGVDWNALRPAAGKPIR